MALWFLIFHSSVLDHLLLHSSFLLLEQAWNTKKKQSFIIYLFTCPFWHSYDMILWGFGEGPLTQRCNTLFWMVVCVLCTHITRSSFLLVPTTLLKTKRTLLSLKEWMYKKNPVSVSRLHWSVSADKVQGITAWPLTETHFHSKYTNCLQWQW